MEFDSFKTFWPFYVSQHTHKTNRVLHVLGSLLGLMTLIILSVLDYGFKSFIFALIIGYGFAWTGHFVFEKNRPATFKYPIYSFMADWKMLILILSGKKLL